MSVIRQNRLVNYHFILRDLNYYYMGKIKQKWKSTSNFYHHYSRTRG